MQTFLKSSQVIDKNLVAKRFGRHASSYDAVTPVQSKMAQKLVDLYLTQQPCREAGLQVLEIGCGTGRLTRLLLNRFPNARITSLDISSSMVEHARQNCPNVEFIVADAEEYILGVDKSYDLIISNATFQWLHCASAFAKRCLDLLNPQGMLVFSTFGNENFLELKDSFSSAYKKHRTDYRSHVVEFESIDFWKKEINATQIFEEKIRQKFSDPLSFLRSVQSAGAANSIKSQSNMSRGILRDMLLHYKNNYSDPYSNEVTCTYHVIYVMTKKSG